MYKTLILVIATCVLGTINAQTAISAYEKNKSALIVVGDTLRIKKSGAVVGCLKKDKLFTRFPRAVNPKAYVDIAAMLDFLNKNTKSGQWYLDRKNGELGFCQDIPKGITREEAFEKYWNSVNLYALYPEISRLNKSTFPVTYTIYTLQRYPLMERTAADLENIDRVTAAFWKNIERIQWSKPKRDLEIKKTTLKKPDFSANDIDGDTDYYLKGKKAMYSSIDLPILYFTLAAVKGDWHSQQKLAWLLEEKTEQDEKYIFSLYKTAAEKGFCKCCPAESAKIDLARCYWHGIGTPSNRKKAYDLAAEFLKENPQSKDAMLLAGLWYLYETPEKARGMKLIEEAEKNGYMPAVLERCIINEYGLAGIPQQINSASNFGYTPPANTVYSWLAGYWLNAKNYERWVKSGGSADYAGM